MKIDKTELENFKLTLPEGIREECFKWINTYYDVTTALYIIKKRSLSTGNIDVPKWCKALGMDGPKNLESFSFSIMTGVTDSDALQDTVDIKYPIVIVEHVWGRGKNKDMSTLIIDGNKRLRRAFLDEIPTIQGYYLTADLAKLCIL